MVRFDLFFVVVAVAVAALPSPWAADHADIVPGKYIVILKDDVDPDTHIAWVKDLHLRSLKTRGKKGVDKVWTESFKGYSGEFDEATLKEISNRNDVGLAVSWCNRLSDLLGCRH